jgi:hypothetical protein
MGERGEQTRWGGRRKERELVDRGEQQEGSGRTVRMKTENGRRKVGRGRGVEGSGKRKWRVVGGKMENGRREV